MSIATTPRFLQRDPVFAWGVSMADKPPPPPPPPPPPKGKKGPPPPPKARKAPPPPKPKKAPPPQGKKPRPKRRKRPVSGKPKGAPKAKPKRKGRKIRIKLGLRQSKIKEEKESYEDQVGWTVSQQILDPYEDLEVQEADVVTHQCSLCGSIMQIPLPKRERYKVICAYSECGHEDMIGG